MFSAKAGKRREVKDIGQKGIGFTELRGPHSDGRKSDVLAQVTPNQGGQSD